MVSTQRFLWGGSVATAALLLTWVSGGAGGCFVSGFTLVETGSTSSSTGGANATSGGGDASGGAGGTPDPCNAASVPTPPTTSDEGPDDQDFYVAFRSIEFGELESSEVPVVGYDLDGRCTCIEPDQVSCVAPGQQSCDGFGGIDNAVSVLFALAQTFSENFRSSFHSQRIENGEWSVLLRVQGYNGQPVDDQVTVSLFASSGLPEDPCIDKDTPESLPKWDGSDRWPIMTVSLEPPNGGVGGGGVGTGGGGGGPTYVCGDPPEPGYSVDRPRFVDPFAFVKDGVLVANLPEAGLVFDGNGAAIDLTAGFITGRLRRADNDQWYLDDGRLAGRWAASDAIQSVARFGGDQLCVGDSLYTSLKTAVCTRRDITANIVGPTAPCDAVSFGMAFTAEPAQPGFVYVPNEDPGEPCPPGLDPADDSCD
ncbi:MAG: hypothetical protein AAF715_03965 [Myxococcota bacterium]